MRVTYENKELRCEKHHKNALHSCGGITLITLVITIIILFILAGVTINIAMDDDIIESTNDVANKTQQQIDNTQQMIDEVRNLY